MQTAWLYSALPKSQAHFPRYGQRSPHSFPVWARYGESFVRFSYDHFTFQFGVSHALPCYIIPLYTDISIVFGLYCIVKLTWYLGYCNKSLSHWSLVIPLCPVKWVLVCSGNGLSFAQCQIITCTERPVHIVENLAERNSNEKDLSFQLGDRWLSCVSLIDGMTRSSGFVFSCRFVSFSASCLMVP